VRLVPRRPEPGGVVLARAHVHEGEHDEDGARRGRPREPTGPQAGQAHRSPEGEQDAAEGPAQDAEKGRCPTRRGPGRGHDEQGSERRSKDGEGPPTRHAGCYRGTRPPDNPVPGRGLTPVFRVGHHARA
jgi:hypothetical protein